MSNEDSNLIGVIPSYLCKPEQVACWSEGGNSHTFTLLRKPSNLNEILKHKYPMAIWRDNGTMTYITPPSNRGYSKGHAGQKDLTLSFRGGDEQYDLEIVGSTDNAIAETAQFFTELEVPLEETSSFWLLKVFGGVCRVQPRFLTQAFEVALPRHVALDGITLGVEQSIVLATWSHPLRLELFECHFEDGGTAFVNALKNRQSSFGWLSFKYGMNGFTDDNMIALCKVDVIERLTTPYPAMDSKTLALRLFSANVDHLEHHIQFDDLSETDWQNLNVTARKLSLCLSLPSPFSEEVTRWCFRCVAELGHFVELSIGFSYNIDVPDIPGSVMEELIGAVLANRNLKVLDLSYHDVDGGDVLVEDLCSFNSHIRTLLRVIKDHTELCTLILHVPHSAFGPDFEYLRELLSYKRNIT